MAFGSLRMIKKCWGILARLLLIKVKHLKHLMVYIAKLHNYCINERLSGIDARTFPRPAEAGQLLFTPKNDAFDVHNELVCNLAAHVEFDEAELCQHPHSYNRDRMAREVEALQLRRPHKNNS